MTTEVTAFRPLVVLCPHFDPDTAPTGVVMTRIVEELVALGHTVHVVTAVPWYRSHRIEPGWHGRLVRSEITSWGSITRVHPFPGRDKSNLARRALGFGAYSLLAGVQADARLRGWSVGRTQRIESGFYKSQALELRRAPEATACGS